MYFILFYLLLSEDVVQLTVYVWLAILTNGLQSSVYLFHYGGGGSHMLIVDVGLAIVLSFRSPQHTPHPNNYKQGNRGCYADEQWA